MSILADKNTRAIARGFTGREVTFHAEQCMAYGIQIVGGVTPFKGGTERLGKPAFSIASEAVKATGADVSLTPVPAFVVGGSVTEAADTGIKLVVIITKYTPVKNMVFARQCADKKGMKVIGPNCPDIITSQKCKLGITPGFVLRKGCVGLTSKSGTLTYETASQAAQSGYGISTTVGIGGDPIIGLAYKELLSESEEDAEIKAIVMISEIGGSLEVGAAKLIKENITKPMAAFITGVTASRGKGMGHVGAIVGSSDGGAATKKEVLKGYGIHVVDSPALIGEEIKKILA